MIELGLARIQALLRNTPQTWKAFHVAGTNGKGSICAYLESMLRANDISCGKFTSPHLIDRWDCISINASAVPETQFRHYEDMVKKRNEDLRLGASEFELLTATAFEIFEAEKIDVGVIEVGLGGRLDATNVLKEKAVTVISKIGLDHQAFLGNTLGEIAIQKAGIMRKGVPCVVDSSNGRDVRLSLDTVSLKTGAPITYIDARTSGIGRLLGADLPPHRAQNLACAHEAFRLAYPQYAQSLDSLRAAAWETTYPGRLQMLDIQAVTGRREKVLLDGAHNPQAAEVLEEYVFTNLRSSDPGQYRNGRVTWVLAASQGKDLHEILKPLLNSSSNRDDKFVAVEFGVVDGMPWVKPMKSEAILKAISKFGFDDSHFFDAQSDLTRALEWASETADGAPIVVAGSLYLVSDVLRLLREKAAARS